MPRSYAASRKERALTQNISILSEVKELNNTIYTVKGTTGNTYKVSISDKSSYACTCYDFALRKQKCKHIYYVLMQKVTAPISVSIPVPISVPAPIPVSVPVPVSATDPVPIPISIPVNDTKSIHLIHRLVLEDVLTNTFKFIDMIDGSNIIPTIYDYIERTYNSVAKDNAMKLYENNVPVVDILKDKNFSGTYITKINDKLFELHMKTIEKINKGWVFNSYSEKVVTEKILRFILVTQ